MAEKLTPEKLIKAAASLKKPEFSRADLAEKLGVSRADLNESFRAARQSGRLEKVRDGDNGTRLFRLTDEGSPPK